MHAIKRAALAAALVAAGLLTACEDSTRSEAAKAGEDLERAAKSTGRALESGAKEAAEAAERGAKKLEQEAHEETRPRER